MDKTTDIATNPVLQTMLERKSVRHFLAKEVSLEDIKTIIKSSARAPSGSNIQPWQVHVVSGRKRDELAAELTAAFMNDLIEEPEYTYYPEKWRDPYLARRRENGWGLYATLGIAKGDRAAMKIQHAQNFNFFGAPVVLFVLIDKEMELGSWLDTGMFVQNILIAAQALGLGTCPQGALINYPSIVRKHLAYPEDKKIVCGIALGYEDTAHIVNSFHTSRVELDEFTTYHLDE
ncbi:MAG: nitroreductase [Alcaligenaceae bacterium]|nr:nitroreductase [Alcaligenaceae bacterium]